MRSDTKTLLFCAASIAALLTYINILFYSAYSLPFGMLDVDGYLYHSGDPDPRLQYINHGNRIDTNQWQYRIFYTLIETVRNPRITFLWLPPLLIAALLILTYQIYNHHRDDALNRTVLFVAMTYGLPFFYTAALYRQLLAMVLLLAGYNLIIRGHRLGYAAAALGILTHIHLTPIAVIYALAERIEGRHYTHAGMIIAASTVIALNTNLIGAIGPLNGAPQPNLYTQLFVLTNPILLLYAYKKPKWDRQHILLTLLTLTMPFSDQSRGLIFLHITLATVAYDKIKQEKTPKYYQLILIALSYLWYTNLLNFLLNSLLKDSIERGLDLTPIFNYLTTHKVD